MDIRITVKDGTSARKIPCRRGESVLSALQKAGIYVSAPCGGKGRCGKCRVRLKDQSEVLACRLYPKEDLAIELIGQSEDTFDVLTEDAVTAKRANPKEPLGLAIDIGTTTIAMALAGLAGGQTLASYAAVNRQRAWGADVISRIQAANDGAGEALQKSIRGDLWKGIRAVLEDAGALPERLQKIAIACNTTMGHLLMGYSCKGLGLYPFRPVNIGTVTGSVPEVLGEGEGAIDLSGCTVTLLPGISTYVGGDILSGLLSCGFDKSAELSMLIDLGTNGEMAIGQKDRILVTSTAAGPAFEGGNISCGTGSVAGAVCGVTLRDGKAKVRTIGGAPPIGICGTGVIETVSELVREGLVDETGLLSEPYFAEGFPLGTAPDGRPITFTQKDVRELQLAKAAVRAGLETLRLRWGAGYRDIRRVYLAGGFGYHIDQEKAVSIGLLPAELSDRLVTAGNTSLSGALAYLRDETAPARAERILSAAREIGLSADKDFNELYMEHMYYGSV